MSDADKAHQASYLSFLNMKTVWQRVWQRLFDKVCHWLTHEPPLPHPISDYEELRHELKPGDVVLVEGRSRVARIIQRLTMSRWSHAVLYLGRLDDMDGEPFEQPVIQHFDRSSTHKRNPQLIIESELGIGTVVRPLSVYQGEHLRICRPEGLTPLDRNRVLTYASSRLGHAYDIRQILDLCRLLMPGGIFSRWRSVLFRKPAPAPRTTCATLIAEAFSLVNFPVRPLVTQDKQGRRLYPLNPLYCTPGDFDYSPWFQVMKFPAPETSARGYYQRLPWQQEGSEELTHEHLDGETLEQLRSHRSRSLQT
ncbi:hypothetical protein [Parendozoicomonas haliclonae]|uniref:Permuted papain-like amidase enzyme, YaeF/YiiX, C92 family n=1 Tax=Parendozoicomonas haliclonae TaxID=1960125 RepID=A0A1X7ALS7_9GAMM|nr:hypothetical protein [Parendozoicomonas haliclonae]SMA49084.1 hypothetical protein EHSB41UT_03041 [Parendozoicomonas haliclonae]